MNMFNLQMFRLIYNLIVKDQKLDGSLKHLISEGFIINNQSFLLKKLLIQQSHIKLSDFVDKSGYECFINSLHIEDYVNDNFIIQAFIFSKTLIEEWME